MKKTLLLILAALAFISCDEILQELEKLPGTEDFPHVITTAEELATVSELLKVDTLVYVELGADIDMAAVKDFVPFNAVAPYNKLIHFDGKGYTISNFTCNAEKYPSLFGVLNGTCKDLNVDKASITANGRCGVIAAVVGSADNSTIFENVTITNSTIVNDDQFAGGVCGTALNANIKNVSFQGTVTSNFPNEAKSGGFIGQAEDASVFENCSVEVVLTGKGTDLGGFAGKVIETVEFTSCQSKAEIVSYAAQKNRVGGFVGWNSSVKTVLKDCHVLAGTTLTDKSGRTESSNGNYGGFIGFGDTTGTILEISECSADVNVDGGVSAYNSTFISYVGYASSTSIKNSYAKGKVFSKTGNYTAGLIGCVSKDASVSITDSYFNGDVEATGGYVGGIVGGSQGKLTLSKVYSEGTVTAMSAYVGGLIGASMNDAITITNCFSTSKIHARGQQCGGLVGTTTNKLTMSDCYASGDVYSGTSGAAGLVGRVQRSSSIVNCIAWNKNVASSRSANNVYASGAILGCAQEKGTYKGCIRRYDMVYTDDFLTLVDHEDCVNAMPPLPSYSTATHQQAYHGKAAAADATLTSVAKSLGWDESVWDFSSASANEMTIKKLGDNKVEF